MIFMFSYILYDLFPFVFHMTNVGGTRRDSRRKIVQLCPPNFRLVIAKTQTSMDCYNRNGMMAKKQNRMSSHLD